MRSIVYQTEQIYQGVVHDACRGAVLYPLACRQKSGMTEAEKTVTALHDRLQAVWRRRLVSISRAGWHAVAVKDGDESSAKLRYTWLHNCPPFSVMIDGDRGKPCHRNRVCPNCYARTIIYPLYKSIEWAVFQGLHQPASDARLVVVVGRHIVDFTARPVTDHLLNLYQKRFAEADQVYDKTGTAVLMTIAPDTVVGHIVVRRSTFMIVPAGADLGPLHGSFEDCPPGVDYQVRDIGDIKKTDIVKAVAFGAQYPLGMLLGNADLAVNILNAAHGGNCPMFVSVGSLRNKAERVAVARVMAAGKECREREA